MNDFTTVIFFVVLLLFAVAFAIFTSLLKSPIVGGADDTNMNDDNTNISEQLVVHISGSPGSGKSTLGDKLARMYPDELAVKDTDEFIQRRIPGGEKNTCAEEYEKHWREIWTAAVNKFIADNPGKIIVFVGLTDHGGPSDKNVLYDITPATKRFYIDIPLRDLFRQYYTRICKIGKTGMLWDDMANGRAGADSTRGIDIREQINRAVHLDPTLLSKPFEPYKIVVYGPLSRPYELATASDILTYFENLIAIKRDNKV